VSDFVGVEIPQWMIKETLWEHLEPLLKKYDVKWRGHGHIYVDHQHGNVSTADTIAAELSMTLSVPAELIRSRLIEFEWLIDVRSISPAQDRLTRVVERFVYWSDDEFEEHDFEMNED